LRIAVLATVLFMAAELPTGAQGQATRKSAGAVTLPASGTFADGGQFSGNITINRFEQRGNQVVAIALVTGVLNRGGSTLSVLAGQAVVPVTVRVGGQVFASGPSRGGARPMMVAYSPEARPPAATLIAQEGCQVINIALGPFDVDVLGVLVHLDPVAFNLTGVAGTPLGDLVCAVSDLIGNVAAIVNLLNNILALLTGLLGGLTGGLGGLVGAVPPIP
jgi:hypothetical protein